MPDTNYTSDIDSSLTINNESSTTDISSTLKIEKLDSNNDINASIVVEKLSSNNNDIDSSVTIDKESSNTDIVSSLTVDTLSSSTDIPVSLTVPTSHDPVVYIGNIDGTVDIKAENYGLDFSGKIEVTNPYDKVQYDAYISGNLDINKELVDKSIDSNLNIDISKQDTDIASTMNINKLDGSTDIMWISAYLNKPGNSEYDLLTGSCTYALSDSVVDIPCSITVPSLYPIGNDDGILGTVNIDGMGYGKEFPSKLTINGITNRYDVDGSVYIMPNPINNIILDGEFKFEKQDFAKELSAYFYLDQGLSRHEFNCQIEVPKNRFIYSIYSHMKVVPRVDTDIPCKLTVFNDQIYDIPANCFLGLERQDIDVVNGSCTLPPFDTKTIDCNLNLMKIDTRREFQGYMYVVQPVNTDIACSMNVETVYNHGVYDIPCKLNVGNYVSQDMFNCSINVLNASQSNIEFTCKLNIMNPLMPARIGIFVDPLWEFEPYVLKSALVTFLDRIYTKNELKIIYGGNPRANWDIHHFADVFSIRPERQIEVPMDFNPRDPIYNRDEMGRFIRTLFTFSADDTHRYVDRVMVFTNTPYTHRTVMMSPLLDMCSKYHIPCVCITSKGEFIEATISNNTITVDSNNPIDQQPHWSYGPNSKHITVFDTGDIV